MGEKMKSKMGKTSLMFRSSSCPFFPRALEVSTEAEALVLSLLSLLSLLSFYYLLKKKTIKHINYE